MKWNVTIGLIALAILAFYWYMMRKAEGLAMFNLDILNILEEAAINETISDDNSIVNTTKDSPGGFDQPYNPMA